MGRHSAEVVSFRFGVVQKKPNDIPEYRSKDVQFDWPECYAPPFPLNEMEKRLVEMKNARRSPE